MELLCRAGTALRIGNAAGELVELCERILPLPVKHNALSDGIGGGVGAGEGGGGNGVEEAEVSYLPC